MYVTARPRYRKNMAPKKDENNSSLSDKRENSLEAKISSQRSRTLKLAIQQYKTVHIWDWLFKSCEENGRLLIRDGLINIKDIEACITKGDCKRLSIRLLAWSLLHCLLASAKSDSSGLVISDGVELTRIDGPRDKLFQWLIEPLLIMKEQIKKLELDENEENSLRMLIVRCNNENPEDWDDTGFPSTDNVRRAHMQGIIRRLEGIVAFMTRVPTFRRRFMNSVKVLYVEALQAAAAAAAASSKNDSEAQLKANWLWSCTVIKLLSL